MTVSSPSLATLTSESKESMTSAAIDLAGNSQRRQQYGNPQNLLHRGAGFNCDLRRVALGRIRQTRKNRAA